MPALSAKKVTNPNELKGHRKPEPGRYHVAINHWDETCKEADQVIVGFQVLAGTVDGQQGRELMEYFKFKDNKGNDATDRIVRLAMVIGLLKPGQELDADLTEAAMGKQLVIEIEKREYTNKEGQQKEAINVANFGYATYALDDPIVEDVPKHSGALGLNGGKPSANGNGASKQQSATAGAASGDGWDSV